MPSYRSIFSGFTVDNLAVAKDFYEKTLGLTVTQIKEGLELHIPAETHVFIYPVSTPKPASFTVLNFEVADIDKTIDELRAKGVTFEKYDSLPAPQDEKGVLRGKAAGYGPDIAWFKDPAGNILSVLES